jgi:two-component system, NtrC family, sensor kinase
MPVTVYVVDDDPLVTESLGTALRLETNYQVEVFQSGPAALVSLAGVPPDVVITDFKMPGMDGLALLRAIRQACPNSVLILLTGYADKESAIQAINEVGIYQYVEKPWDLEDLLLKIRAGVERTDLLRRLSQANADLERRHADLTRSHAELAKAHDQLRQAHDRLIDAERLAAVGRVASGIAHEIGNQLSLVGYAEAIKARAAGNAEIAEFADVIVAAQKRLLAMVGEIKDFARGEGDGDPRDPLALEPADVAAVVDEALAILRYDREVAARRVEREIERRPLARLNRGKFTQVIINLVRNAAQASPPRGRVRVRLDQDPGNDDVRLTISDEGAGMPPETLARLGEPFFTTRGERGTGLGIGISRRIVEEHRGKLAFDSAPGKGTRVTVTLPGLA